MIKILVQLLLSVMVGFGAALGFNPKVRVEVRDTLLRANVSLHESVSSVGIDTNKVTTNLSTAVSAKVNVEDSSKAGLRANLSLKNDLKAKINASGASTVNILPDLSLNHALIQTDRVNLEGSGSGLEFSANEDGRSTLDLNPGFGR